MMSRVLNRNLQINEAMTIELSSLLSSFGIIFFAELGDKTQLATLALCSKHKPLSVFAGAMLAFASVSGVSVLIGEALASTISTFWVNLGSGIIFILVGVYVLFSKKTEGTKAVKHKFSTIATISSFFTIALMELGDKTQLTILVLATRGWPPLFVFLGAMLAFLTLTLVGVVIGTSIFKFMPERYVRVSSAVIFILIGVLFLLAAFTNFELLK